MSDPRLPAHRNSFIYLIDWMNENPDIAVKVLPQVEKYLRWKHAPFTQIGGGRTGRQPFRTMSGREIK